MTNKEKFNQLFEETFGVSAYSIFELECTNPGKKCSKRYENTSCSECEYDASVFWKQEYKEKSKQ